MESSRRAHSSVVEHRTAVPVVIGSNPIVPFFFLYDKLISTECGKFISMNK